MTAPFIFLAERALEKNRWSKGPYARDKGTHMKMEDAHT